MLQLLLEVLGVEDKNSADIRKVQTESAETLRSNMKEMGSIGCFVSWCLKKDRSCV